MSTSFGTRGSQGQILPLRPIKSRLAALGVSVPITVPVADFPKTPAQQGAALHGIAPTIGCGLHPVRSFRSLPGGTINRNRAIKVGAVNSGLMILSRKLFAAHRCPDLAVRPVEQIDGVT
jgi:hypothetical protein